MRRNTHRSAYRLVDEFPPRRRRASPVRSPRSRSRFLLLPLPPYRLRAPPRARRRSPPAPSPPPPWRALGRNISHHRDFLFCVSFGVARASSPVLRFAFLAAAIFLALGFGRFCSLCCCGSASVGAGRRHVLCGANFLSHHARTSSWFATPPMCTYQKVSNGVVPFAAPRASNPARPGAQYRYGFKGSGMRNRGGCRGEERGAPPSSIPPLGGGLIAGS